MILYIIELIYDEIFKFSDEKNITTKKKKKV